MIATVDNTRYFSRSWSMLTRDKGWIKPILILALVMLIPIVGPIAVLGYELEWARLTAWGTDSAPRQTGIDAGSILKTGWRGFVVMLGWTVLIGIVGWLLVDVLFSFNDSVQSLIRFVWYLATLLLASISMIAALRATIYQSFGSGYQFDRILEMSKHDFGGIVRITGISVLGSVCGFLIGFVMMLVTLASSMSALLSVASPYSSSYGYGSTYGYNYSYGYNSATDQAARAFLSALAGSWPIILVFVYLILVFSVLFSLLVANSCGLWLRQFNVGAWGASADPLPVPLSTGPATGAPAPAAPLTGQQYAAPTQQAPQQYVAPAQAPQQYAAPTTTTPQYTSAQAVAPQPAVQPQNPATVQAVAPQAAAQPQNPVSVQAVAPQAEVQPQNPVSAQAVAPQAAETVARFDEMTGQPLAAPTQVAPAAAVDPDTTVTPIIPVVSEAAPVVAPEASSSAPAAEAAIPSVPVSPASAPEPVQPTTVPTDEPKTE